MIEYDEIEVGKKKYTVLAGTGLIIKLQKKYKGIGKVVDAIFPYEFQNENGESEIGEADIEAVTDIIKMASDEAVSAKKTEGEELKELSKEEIMENIVHSKCWTDVGFRIYNIITESISGGEKNKKKETQAEQKKE